MKCIKLKTPLQLFDLTALWVNTVQSLYVYKKKANHGKISQRLLYIRMFLHVKIK
jgi:hypothetical protein